jgi:transposase
MANVLKMTMIEAIQSLRSAGLSCREIARRLGIDRGTVSRRLRDAGEPVSKPANAPIFPAGTEPALAGFELPTGLNGPSVAGAEPPIGLPAGRTSDASPWLAWLLEQRQRGLSATRIHQDLLAEHPAAAAVSYDSVRRLLNKRCATTPVPYRRIESPPGFEAQVDFGTGVPVNGPDGRRRRTHVIRVVLSHSRRAYSEVVFTQSTDDFIRCLENAFEHFGGVPRTLVIDNLKAGVLKADWFDPELNPKLQEFCHHYGTVVLPTKPRTPRHKGKVERGIDYVQENALKGRKFTSLDEQNRRLEEWECTTADRRIHGTTKKQVIAHFNESERAALLPLPSTRFENFREAKRKVSRDGHVEVAKAFYSVPPEYLGREVWVRWNGRTVRVFNDRMQQIAIHAKHDQGRFSTDPIHLDPTKINGLERGIAYLLGKVRLIGPHTHAWAEAVVDARGIEGHRVVQGLLSLTRKHTCAELERACETALSNQCYRLRPLRQLITHEADRQQPLEFLAEHPIIRPLEDYAAVVARAIHRRQSRPSMGEGFGSHDTGIHKDHRPAGVNLQGDGGHGECLWSGYRSSGCSSAEPDSFSPDDPSVAPDSSP